MKIDANESYISLGQKSGMMPDDSSIFDKRKVFTSLIFFTGKKLDQRIYLEDFIDSEGRMDTIFLKAGIGIVDTFLLNQVLTMPRFLTGMQGEFINVSLKKNKRITPINMLEVLTAKKMAAQGQQQAYFMANLFFGLDRKTGGLVFFNVDSVIGQQSKNLNMEKNVMKVSFVDRFYGFGQSVILMSKIYPYERDSKQLMTVLAEFKKTFYKFELQRIFETDSVIQAIIGGQKVTAA